MLRRLGTGGLAVVLAASLYGCAGGEPGSPAEAVPAEHDGLGQGRTGDAAGKASDGAGFDGADTAEGAAGRVEPPAEPGRPAVVQGTGTGEEQRATVRTVALDQPARPAEGLEIEVTSTRPVEAVGMGPGGAAGPAIAVVVTVRNSTDATVSTLGGSVTVAYGPEDRPASPSRQPGDDPLPVAVAPGKSVSGTYTFLVPEDQHDDVVVTASYRATDPAAVFAGPARSDGADR